MFSFSLVNFCLQVLVFMLVGVVLAGAGFGYWLVRKFVVADDGSVDVGVAQFVKWALRVVAVTFIFQVIFIFYYFGHACTTVAACFFSHFA